ncbi:MAG TPA: MauE/DoxX family redox-associated membrane protein [Longimicrobium sp.]|nr:MauE/DoxX family redox-associated membrane protein [Longimicrobium sp.]
MSKPLSVLRIFLGLLFVIAGLTKLLPPDHRYLFEMAVSAHGLLPPAAVVWVAWLLPLFEIVLGAALVAGWRPRLAAPAAAVLLFGFLGLMFTAYFTGVQADCGCFGFGEPIGRWTLARTGALLLVAIVVSVGAWRRRGAAPAAPAAAADRPGRLSGVAG